MPRHLRDARTLASIASLALLTTQASQLSCASSRRASQQDEVEVAGVVRDREGVGVPGISVILDPANDVGRGGLGWATDRNGRFRARVKRGSYCWILYSDRARIPTVWGDTIHLTESKERLDYKYGGVRVEGRILGPDGSPMSAGSVEAFGVDDLNAHVTGVIEDGRYRVYLPPSSYWFHANPKPERYARIGGPPQVRISADTTIDITVGGHLITGRATLGRTKPLRGAEIKAIGGDTLMISARDRTRRDGRFELSLPSAGYGLILWPGPDDPHIAPRIYPLKVGGPQAITLDVAGVVWHGTVRDSTTRSPLRSVYVMAWDTRLSAQLQCQTDERGRFMFVLEPGREYVLWAGKPPLVPRGEQARGLPAVKDSTIDLYVGKSGNLISGLK